MTRQKEDARKEHPIYRATEKELRNRIEELTARERDLRKLCEKIGVLRQQAIKLSEQRAKQLALTEDREKQFSELSSVAQQYRSDCDSTLFRKRQLDKEADHSRSRLDSETNSLTKLKARVSEVAKSTGKVVELGRALTRRKRLMHLQIVWSKGLMNKEMKAFTRWRLSL